jgi:hypothetical protein
MRPPTPHARLAVDPTRRDRRLTPCGKPAIDTDHERTRFHARGVATAAEPSWPPTGRPPRWPPRVPARPCPRTGRRPLEQRRIDDPGLATQLPVGATKARCRDRGACVPCRGSTPSLAICRRAATGGTRAARITPCARRAAWSAGPRRRSHRRADRCASVRSVQPGLSGREGSTRPRQGDKSLPARRRLGRPRAADRPRIRIHHGT